MYIYIYIHKPSLGVLPTADARPDGRVEAGELKKTKEGLRG